MVLCRADYRTGNEQNVELNGGRAECRTGSVELNGSVEQNVELVV